MDLINQRQQGYWHTGSLAWENLSNSGWLAGSTQRQRAEGSSQTGSRDSNSYCRELPSRIEGRKAWKARGGVYLVGAGWVDDPASELQLTI